MTFDMEAWLRPRRLIGFAGGSAWEAIELYRNTLRAELTAATNAQLCQLFKLTPCTWRKELIYEEAKARSEQFLSNFVAI